MAEVDTSNAVATDAVATDAVAVPSFSPLVAELIEPIAGADPAGVDVKYDDDFLELKTQVNDLSSATGTADFGKIVGLGRKILQEKSKDLMVVGYLTLGLMRTKGVDGLVEGWVLAEVVVDRFWEGLHPRRAKPRRSALQFMATQSRDWLQQQEAPETSEREALESALESVKGLLALESTKEGLTDKTLEAALSGVLAALKERRKRVPEPEPEPEPVAGPEPTAPSAEDAPAAEPSPAPAPAAPAPVDVPAVTADSDVGTVLAQVARALRDQDLTNPLPYRLLRANVWGAIRTAPKHENGLTLLWPPDDRKVNELQRWVEMEAYERVIKQAEAFLFFDSFDVWLTMQRIVVRAMEEAGEAYAAAAEAVKLEVGLLLRRIPEMTALSFKEGTPYADAMTVEWIETQVLPLFGSGEEDGGGVPQDPVAEQYKEARRLLGTGDLKGAIALLQEGGAKDASQEARFRRRLYLAMLCMRGDQLTVARSILESLDKEVAHHALDAWNPALTLDVWSNLYTCYNKLIQTNEYGADDLLGQAQHVLSRISNLDAGYALSLMAGPVR